MDHAEERPEGEAQAGPEAPGAERAPAEDPRVAELNARLAALSEKLDQALRAVGRLQQEREDFRRRLERERDRVLEVERGNVALGLLEAVDEMDRSLAAAGGGSEAITEGLRLIRDGLLRRALSSGIERMAVLGDPFDPTLHEAVDSIPCDRAEDDGRVIEEVRAGYRHGARILRPARVRVGRFPTGARAGSGDSSPAGEAEE